MTVKYSLTRGEVVSGFWNSMASSAPYRTKILLFVAAFSVLIWRMETGLTRPAGWQDVAAVLVGGAWFALFMSVWLFLRAKTSERTLSLTDQGIHTEIGTMKGEIPWKTVSTVEDIRTTVLIARTNGNVFYVPHRAFEELSERDHFIAEVRRFTAQER